MKNKIFEMVCLTLALLVLSACGAADGAPTANTLKTPLADVSSAAETPASAVASALQMPVPTSDVLPQSFSGEPSHITTSLQLPDCEIQIDADIVIPPADGLYTGNISGFNIPKDTLLKVCFGEYADQAQLDNTGRFYKVMTKDANNAAIENRVEFYNPQAANEFEVPGTVRVYCPMYGNRTKTDRVSPEDAQSKLLAYLKAWGVVNVDITSIKTVTSQEDGTEYEEVRFAPTLGNIRVLGKPLSIMDTQKFGEGSAVRAVEGVARIGANGVTMLVGNNILINPSDESAVSNYCSLDDAVSRLEETLNTGNALKNREHIVARYEIESIEIEYIVWEYTKGDKVVRSFSPIYCFHDKNGNDFVVDMVDGAFIGFCD